MATPHITSIPSAPRATLAGHIEIARIDHWVKNVFVIPGIVVPLAMDPSAIPQGLGLRILFGLIAVSLVTSSNYVINEVMDAPFDRFHPVKGLRPVPAGRVNVRLAVAEWLLLMVAGLEFASLVSTAFTLTMLTLWLMGCAYNVSPIRTKDIPYVDVLSEAVNNPLRMLAGWFITGTVLFPSASLLLSYWMVGCYFMALKRLAEYRDLDDPGLAAAYRKSFAHYTEVRLLTAIVFYSSSAMLFFGAFLVRYRMELLLSVPLIALVMAEYLHLAYKPNSAAQRPEGLYREPRLMVPVIVCACVMMLLFFVDIPVLDSIFSPTLPRG